MVRDIRLISASMQKLSDSEKVPGLSFTLRSKEIQKRFILDINDDIVEDLADHCVFYKDTFELVFQKGDSVASGRDAEVFSLNSSSLSSLSYIRAREQVITVTFKDKLKATDCGYMFYKFEKLRKINHMEKLDTSEVINMKKMFEDCVVLEEVDLSGFNTSKVTSMCEMFRSCCSLKSLDLTSFDTSSVNDFAWMFNSCNELKTIYVTDKFDVSGATYTGGMFEGCLNLVGGNGSTYTDCGLNGDAARFDRPGQAGYFTEK